MRKIGLNRKCPQMSANVLKRYPLSAVRLRCPQICYEIKSILSGFYHIRNKAIFLYRKIIVIISTKNNVILTQIK